MKTLAIFAIAIVLIAVVIAGAGLLFMIVWNMAIPAVLAGPVISFWESISMLILLSMIGGALGLRYDRGTKK